MENTLSELYGFLNYLGPTYINKIPKKLYQTVIDNKNANYSPSYDSSIALEELNLSHKTWVLISIIHLKYWASEKDKEELTKIYIQNDIDFQNKVNEFKNNPDWLKNETILSTESTELDESLSTNDSQKWLIVGQENTSILHKIKKILVKFLFGKNIL